MAADLAGSLQPIHLGHLHVHQDDVVVLPFQGLDGLQPVGSQVGAITHLTQQMYGQLLVEGVVLSQQDAQRAAFCQGRGGLARVGCFTGWRSLRGFGRGYFGLSKDPGQQVKELALLDRFGQVSRPFNLIASRFAPSQRRKHDQRQRLSAAQFADFLRQMDAIHLWHVQIQNGQVERLALAQPIQGLCWRTSLAGRHTPGVGLQQDNLPVGAVVVHHQQPAPCQAGLFAGIALAHFQRCFPGLDGEVESRANAHLALDPHFAAHHLGQPF